MLYSYLETYPRRNGLARDSLLAGFGLAPFRYNRTSHLFGYGSIVAKSDFA